MIKPRNWLWHPPPVITPAEDHGLELAPEGLGQLSVPRPTPQDLVAGDQQHPAMCPAAAVARFPTMLKSCS